VIAALALQTQVIRRRRPAMKCLSARPAKFDRELAPA
jgi:hypothetical protein